MRYMLHFSEKEKKGTFVCNSIFRAMPWCGERWCTRDGVLSDTAPPHVQYMWSLARNAPQAPGIPDLALYSSDPYILPIMDPLKKIDNQ